MSMEEKIDQAKGAIKEGVGKLTGDKKIEKEGAAEKAASKVKEVAEDVNSKVKEVAEDVNSKVKEVAEDVKDAVEGTIDGVKNIVNKDKK